MNYTEMIKSDLKEKYSNMLCGKTKRQNHDIVIADSAGFLSNFKILTERLNREAKEINDALSRINGDRNARLKAEKAEKDRIAKAARDAKEKEERARREAEYAIQATKDAKETRIQTIALASPIVLSVIFGIILFSNKEQISIISNFSSWCTAWVFFTIASLITSISLLKKRFGEWTARDNAARASSAIIAIIMVICSFVVFINSCKLSFNFDPTSFISFDVTGIEKSTSYSSYVFTISFKLKNNSSVKVTYVNGEMKLYNGTTEVASYNVYFNGEYQAGQSYNTTVEFEESNSDSLYNTSYANLAVTYRITSMKFNGNYKEYEYNGDTITLKESSSSTEYPDEKDNELSKVFEEAMEAFDKAELKNDGTEEEIACAVAIMDDYFEEISAQEKYCERMYDAAEKYYSNQEYGKAYLMFGLVATVDYKDSESKMQIAYNLYMQEQYGY